MIQGSIIAKPQVFAAAVKWAAKFVTAKPIVPVHAGVLLTAGGGRLEIAAFSETVTARAVVPVEGDGSGQAVVSGRLLAELSGTFPNAAVEVTGDGADLAISAGRWRGTLPGFAVEDWPEPPAAPPSIGTVGGDALASAVARAAVAAHADQTQMLSNLHLRFAGGQVIAGAGDGPRMARATAAASLTGGGHAVLSAQVMHEVAGAFAGPDDIVVGLDDNRLSLASPHRAVVLTQKGADGKAAGLVEVIDRMAGHTLPEHVTVRAADLLAPLKRAAMMADKGGPTRLVFGADLITVAARAEEGRKGSDEDVAATYAGSEKTIGFNPKYLADALATAPGDTVDIAIDPQDQESGRPWHVLMTVPGDGSWQHVLQPIKL